MIRAAGSDATPASLPILTTMPPGPAAPTGQGGFAALLGQIAPRGGLPQALLPAPASAPTILAPSLPVSIQSLPAISGATLPTQAPPRVLAMPDMVAAAHVVPAIAPLGQLPAAASAMLPHTNAPAADGDPQSKAVMASAVADEPSAPAAGQREGRLTPEPTRAAVSPPARPAQLCDLPPPMSADAPSPVAAAVKGAKTEAAHPKDVTRPPRAPVAAAEDRVDIPTVTAPALPVTNHPAVAVVDAAKPPPAAMAPSAEVEPEPAASPSGATPKTAGRRERSRIGRGASETGSPAGKPTLPMLPEGAPTPAPAAAPGGPQTPTAAPVPPPTQMPTQAGADGQGSIGGVQVQGHAPIRQYAREGVDAAPAVAIPSSPPGDKIGAVLVSPNPAAPADPVSASAPAARFADHPALAPAAHASPDRVSFAPAEVAQPADRPTPAIPATPGSAGRALGLEIARHVGASAEHFTIRMTPADHGRVDVRLHLSAEGHLRADIQAEKSGTLALLRQEAPDLGRALDQAGIRTDGQSLRFGGGQGGADHRQDAPTGGHRPLPDPAPGDAEAETGDDSNVQILRGQGSIDVIA